MEDTVVEGLSCRRCKLIPPSYVSLADSAPTTDNSRYITCNYYFIFRTNSNSNGSFLVATMHKEILILFGVDLLGTF